MPLDRTKGEQIEGLDGPFKVVPNTKYRETPLFEEAAAAAALAFRRAGYPLAITFDDDQVLTQEYPHSGQIAMVFVTNIRGAEQLYVHVWALPPEMVASLRASGQWSHPTELVVH